jgi:small-conductance mechanosensitive channel
LGVLAALGVGFSSVVFGGAFLTVIIGLAGQTMFGNLIAGIGLILFRPFVVGERIVFVAWQYPVLMPSFPHEALRPGYTGTVTDINLMYTALRDDAGLEIFVPNGVIIQAMIENHTRSGERLVRLRFEVSLELPWDDVAVAAAAVARRLPYPVQWLPADVGPTSYGVLFLARAPAGHSADQIRAELLEAWIPALQAIRAQAAQPTQPV